MDTDFWVKGGIGYQSPESLEYICTIALSTDNLPVRLSLEVGW